MTDVMAEPTAEDLFITLASHHVRKVASLEGSKYYGLPIGAPITADIVQKMQAEKGSAPKGALTSEKSPNKGSFAPKAQAGLAGAGAAKASSGGASVTQKLKVNKPSLSGPNKFKVGKSQYSAPNGSKLIHPASNPDMAYVYSPDGKVTAFNESGQIEVPEPLHGLLAQKFAGDLTEDPNYDETEFDAKAASYDMSNLKVGAVLNDKNGEPQFTKQEDGTFKHNLLGAVVQEKDIQPLFDNGELVPEDSAENEHLDSAFADTEAMNFASMETDEVQAALDKMKPGAQLSYGDQQQYHVVKEDDGSWTLTGEDIDAPEGQSVNSNTLKYLKSGLKVSDQSSTPQQKVDDAFDKKVTEAETNDPSAPDLPTLEEEDKKAAQEDAPKAPAGPSDQEKIDNAEKMFGTDSAQHKKAQEQFAAKDEPQQKTGVVGNKSVLTGKELPGAGPEVANEPLKKQFKLGQKIAEKDVADLPDNTKLLHQWSVQGEHWTVKDDGKTLVGPSGIKYASDSGTIKDGQGWFVHQLPDSGQQAEKIDDTEEPNAQNSNSTSATVADVTQAIDETADDLATPAPKKPESLKAGDEPTPEYVDAAKGGAVLSFGEGHPVWTKDQDGEGWTSTNGTPASNEVMKQIVEGWGGEKKIDALKSEPAAETPGFQVGDTIDSMEKFGALPAGTVLMWKGNFGSTDEYSKLENGNWVGTKYGSELSPSMFQVSVEAKHLHVQSLPGHVDEPGDDPLFGYANGQPITKMSHIIGFPEGTQVHVNANKKGFDPNKGFVITKGENKNWHVTSASTGDDLGGYSLNDFGADMKDGTLFFGHGPEADGEKAAAEVLNPDADFKVSTDATHTIGKNTYSTADLKDAHDILVSDSAFQVKYSLNKLPEGHTFYKNDEGKNDLVDAAKAAFPDEKGKAPVVKYLKQQLGLQPEQSEDEHTATGPMIKIGADSPAMQQTGMDGGEFAYSDIEDAIKTLKASKSKLFKNELAKKGNPLGDLSPNHLIADPDPKDKEANKQKFIAVLEDILAKHEPSTEEHVISDSEMDDIDQAVADIYDALETAEPDAVDGKTFLKGDAAAAVPTGATGVNSKGVALTKGEGKTWLSDTGAEYQFPDHTSGVHVTSLPKDEEDDLVLEAEDTGLDYQYGVHGLTTKEHAQQAPIGQQATSHGSTYTKVSDNKWSIAKNGNEIDASVSDIDFNHANVTWVDPEKGHKSVDMSATNSESEDALDGTNTLTVGDALSLEQIEGLPVGSKIKLGNGNVLTRANDDKWHFTLNGTDLDFTSKELADASEHITLHETPNTYESGDLLEIDDIDGLSIGTVIVHKDAAGFEDFYTKTSDGWDMEGTPATSEEIKDHMNVGAAYYLHSTPTGTPAYATTPAAVKDKAPNSSDPAAWEIELGTTGQVLQGKNDTSLFITQNADNTWTSIKNGQVIGSMTMQQVTKDIGKWQFPQYDGPEYNKSGLMPGKYAGTGKAYMLVMADGKGLYVNSKGKVSSLSANKVKSNHEAGMNLYSGLPSNLPNVGDEIDEKGKKKPAPLADLTLADGTYFSGHPNSPKVTVYEVKDGEVQVFKPLGSVPGSKAKMGGSADHLWFKGAQDGAAFEYNGSKIVKQNGVWTSNGDADLPEGQFMPWWAKQQDTPPKTWDDLIEAHSKHYGSLWYETEITNHGLQAPAALSNAAAQTQIKKGNIVDADGFSQVPDGYAGQVQMLGNTYDVKTLLDAQKMMENWDESQGNISAQLKAKGFTIPAAKYLKPYTEKHFGGVANAQNNREALKMALAKALSNLDTTIPEADVAGYFQYDSLGIPMMPAAALKPVDQSNKTDMGNWIKSIGAEFGGGGIIGQHHAAMDKYQRQSWVTNFMDGNFKAMYALEVQAAASKNLPHASGYQHPGYEDNADFHKVQWGAAVSGEVSALTDIPGTWTGNIAYATQAEIDNYLIQAQMQNPTYLTQSEKRQWVKFHRQSNKVNVDTLSIRALDRKNTGEGALTEDITWSDDVKPGKSYNALFDASKFPVNWGNSQANEYVEDSANDSDLLKAKDAWYKQNPYSSNGQFLNNYFQEKADEEAAKALIPVYKIDADQTVTPGTQAIYNVSDQFGNKFYFKPRPDSQLDNYRIEAEHAGNELGRLMGFKSAKSQIVVIDGQRGQLQADVGGIGNLHGANYGSLSSKTLGDIAKEHVLDWFLDNDDTKGDNVALQADGSVIGIDKGRAWKHFGAWSGLSGDESMNTNADTIYARMFKAMRNGKIDKATADEAYIAMQKQITRMQKVQDSRITAILQDGMKNRPSYAVAYSIDGKTLPNSFEGLNAAVLDRKAHLAEDFENLWKGVYADAGYGDLPEVPQHPLGDEIASGLDSTVLHEKVQATKAFGTTAMVNGAHVIGGTVHTWVDKYKDGTNNLHGEAYLAPKKQEELTSLLQQYVAGPDLSVEKSVADNFGKYDFYYGELVTGAKTINHHANDGEYNPDKIATLDKAIKDIETELNEWSNDLKTNKTMPDGTDAFHFSTGHTVPMKHIDQYKMMLDSYSKKYLPIKQAQADQTKIYPHVTQYEPLTLHESKKQYVNDNGDVLTPMTSGYLLKSGGTVEAISGTSDTVKSILAGNDGWHTSEQPEEEKTKGLGFKVVKRAFTNEKKGKFNPETGEKTSNQKSESNVDGSKGSEYEITLDSGEKIFFRDRHNTNTAKGQEGKLMFTANGADDQSDISVALNNIQMALQTLGIDAGTSEHEDAELTYWREMYGVLATRNANYGDAKYKKVKKAMEAKIAEIGGKPEHFIENFNEKASVEEQNTFWRKAWGDAFGHDKIETLISTEGYLPKFDHLNMNDVEQTSGKPNWERFDVDLDELLANSNFMLTSRVGSSNGTILPVVQSGGALSAEERLRILDDFNAGGLSMSAHSDQTEHSSSNNIYMRIRNITAWGDDNAVYNPRLLLRTRTYSFDHDAFGDHGKRATQSPADPKYAVDNFKGGNSTSNETVAPHYASLLDNIEVYGFDDAAERNNAIQELKKRGIEMIRGVKVEDRLVMRMKMNEAIAKVKATWAKK